jgi:serine/threonine-protein kinase
MLRSNGGPETRPDAEWHGGAARRFFESAMWGHMSTTDLPGSSLLAGRYRLVERLGAGGMSVVWRGFDEVLGRQVAVKVLPPSTSTDPSFRRRLRAEAQAAARLSHPHITNVYDYGEATTVDGEPVPYVVMELIDGESLAAVLARVRRLPWQAAVRITSEVAAALAAAHARGIVHRDVTPANVMLTPTGAKVVDFGISALIGENDIDPDGSLLGTPAYLAPERLEGGQVSPATDVYAVGLLVYRTLIGQLPWDVGTTTALLRAHQYVEPDPLPPVEGLPPAVAALVGRCLEKRPSDRPSSAELAHVLAGISAGAPASARGYAPDWSAESGEDTTILPSARSWTDQFGRPAAAAAARFAPAYQPAGRPAAPAPEPEDQSGPLAGAAARNSRFAALRSGPVLNTPPVDANPALRPAFDNQPPVAAAPSGPPRTGGGDSGDTGNSRNGRYRNQHTRRVLFVAAAVAALTVGTYAWSLAAGRDEPRGTRPNAQPSVVPVSGKCVVSYAVYSDDQGRFSAQVTVANRADTAVRNWSLWFLMPGDQVVSGKVLGNVHLAQDAHQVTVTSATTLSPQKTLTMPLTGRYVLNNTAPLAFKLNGDTCETFVSPKPGAPSQQVEHLSNGTVRLAPKPVSSSGTPVPGVSVDPKGIVHITPTTAPAGGGKTTGTVGPTTTSPAVVVEQGGDQGGDGDPVNPTPVGSGGPTTPQTTPPTTPPVTEPTPSPPSDFPTVCGDFGEPCN